MPELPDIDVFSRYIDSTSLYLVIEQVEISDERIIKDIDPGDFMQKVKGKEFTSVRRHGKYLFVRLNSPNILMFHFGMTGTFKYLSNSEEPPEYEKVGFVLSNGYRLSFMNKRMLGQVKIIDDESKFLQEKEIGPDALSEEMNWDYFKDQMDGKRGMVKSALMNQKILAGIGNEFSDEILFQLKWYPKIKVTDLDESELQDLYELVKKTLKQGVKSNMEYSLMPGDFMIPQRSTDRKCPRCNSDLERVKVSGRNSTHCPSCQRRGR
jgi:formamidopyrimidine-DNA glycosylase